MQRGPSQILRDGQGCGSEIAESLALSAWDRLSTGTAAGSTPTPTHAAMSFPYPNRASKLWAELEGPKCPTIQQVSAAAGGGVAKVTSFLAGMDAAGHAAGHESRVMRLLDDLPPGVTVIVASQGVNPELPRKLDKQKKACEDRRCASVWSVEQGRLLEALEVRAREGCVFVAVT